ncbi:hypothetical protein NUACC21_51310 [Scytonema sp. NUACC21]
MSDGNQIDNFKFGDNKKTRRTLKISQRRTSRKTKGSKNRKKSALKVGRLHKKITDICFTCNINHKVVIYLMI